jgi:hypothetical protein
MIGKLLNTILTKGLERFGRFYSSYRGFVLYNEDPDKMKRIMVYCPQLTGLNRKGLWAYPKGIATGAKWGLNLIPEIGDMVWVEFEYGNPRYPIWSFAYRRKGEAANLSHLEEPKEYGFQSPNGNWVNISDNGNIITVQTAGGHQIVLSDDDESILISTSAGQRITLDDAAGVIKFNDGSNGSFINIGEIVQKINVLEDRMNTHQHFYIPSSGTPIITTLDPTTNPPIILTSPSEIEDATIIH